MSNLQESNGGGDERGSGDVAVGVESSSPTRISIQTLQGIYNELTGKSERVGKSYGKPFQINLSDIENLNRRIEQAHDQYHIVSNNCNVFVYYVDDTRDKFSSFDRFALHSDGSASAVESIFLKYNFLVCLPKTRAIQNYTVSIRLASRVAVAKRMMSEFYGAPPAILRLMGNRTAVVHVEYVDYLVARNFLNIIDEWFRVIPVASESKVLNWLQIRSHAVPRVSRFLTAMFVGSVLVMVAPNFIKGGSTDLLNMFRFSACGLMVVYAAYMISSWCAGLVEGGLDGYSELSYLKITKGDDREISNASDENKFAFIKGVGGFLLTVCVSIFTKLIVGYLIS
ncbi:hypothetical protein LBW62_21865 [Ralstonia solanacearum]|uniref:hypothetical protein n=1 Tax=Ralstonia solanacearum TaxID=305 RepID=UPI000B09F1BF|nr:hypothetical protein [Ralstonia solanacearum]MDB0543887.1 hypothetical protein [Ralstonia solanacearum]MDB0554261.1 hypothetical protein [Ralstonia solanacearum]MDB0558825.1 hypothetical protein [Ralstonia solanacearum]